MSLIYTLLHTLSLIFLFPRIYRILIQTPDVDEKYSLRVHFSSLHTWLWRSLYRPQTSSMTSAPEPSSSNIPGTLFLILVTSGIPHARIRWMTMRGAIRALRMSVPAREVMREVAVVAMETLEGLWNSCIVFSG